MILILAISAYATSNSKAYGARINQIKEKYDVKMGPLAKWKKCPEKELFLWESGLIQQKAAAFNYVGCDRAAFQFWLDRDRISYDYLVGSVNCCNELYTAILLEHFPFKDKQFLEQQIEVSRIKGCSKIEKMLTQRRNIWQQSALLPQKQKQTETSEKVECQEVTNIPAPELSVERIENLFAN